MLFCKGDNCIWREQCSRYVLGRGAEQMALIDSKWMNACTNGKKFYRVGR